MKNLLKLIGVTLIIVFVFASCSKKDNPTDNDIFIGTYSGKTSYTKTGESVALADGKVTVSKLGNTYRFDFKDNGSIPAITGVTITKGESGYIGTVNGYTGVINISASNLNIAVAKDGAAWTADCNR